MQIKQEQLLIILSFAAIYFIWGSTYLVNWYAIQDIPPFLMAGSRFLTAGLLLFGFMHLMGSPMPSRKNWWHAFITGSLFLSIGTGGVVWAEQFIDSNVAALLIGGEPLIIVLLMWQLKSKRPKWNGILGVILGMFGMYLLVGQPQFIANRENVWGLFAIAISMLGWGVIAVKINDFDLPQSRFQSSAMQMICGGIVLLLFSAVGGQLQDFSFARLTSRSVFSWFYLVFLGSIVAFTAFNYLLSKVSPDKVATSNYVNPIVAMLLGWGLNDEHISSQSLLAASILIFSVFLINNKWKPK